MLSASLLGRISAFSGVRNLVGRSCNKNAAILSALCSSSVTPQATCSYVTSCSKTNHQLNFTRSYGHEVFSMRPIPDDANVKDRPKEHTTKEIEELVLKCIKSFDRYPTDKEAADVRFRVVQQRTYGGKPPLTQGSVEKRILLVMKLFDKIDPNKLTMDTHIINDLGLDSLDHVEIIMAIEDEFMIEIPDGEAERLMTPKEIWQFICDKEDVIE